MKFKVASKDQHLTCIRNNHPEWGTPLTIEEYMARENDLQLHFPYEFTPYVLLSDTQEILAQLETYQNIIRIFFYNQDSIKCLESSKSAAIASVFVPIEHRKKGFGSELMSRLNRHLTEDLKLLGSCLYADIDPTFYQKHSWIPYSPLQLTLKSKIVSHQNVQCILSDDLHLFIDRYNRSVEDNVDKHYATEANRQDLIVSFKLTRASIEMFRIRSKCYFTSKHKELFSKHYGQYLSLNDFVIYFYDYRESILYIISHLVSCKENARILLDSALNEAYISGLEQVKVWNPDHNIIASVGISYDVMKYSIETSSQFSESNWKLNHDIDGGSLSVGTSVPCLSINRQNVKEAIGTEFGEVLWFSNEKYSWA